MSDISSLFEKCTIKEEDKLEHIKKKPIRKKVIKKKQKKPTIEIIFDSDSSDSDNEEDNEEEEKVEEEKPKEELFNEPDYFRVRTLKPYSIYKHQIDAIEWMKEIERSNKLGMKGGILALIMGAGKTLSVLELCMSEQNEYPSLVVCSKTVSYEWRSNINKFFGDTCPYFYFYNQNMKKEAYENISYEAIKHCKIIITTYETIMNTAKKNKLYDKQFIYDQFDRHAGILNSRKPTIEETKRARGGLVLFKTPWNRVTCDESHRFVNPKSATFYSVMCLYGEKKLCLSGTPIRNYSSDLYSQFRFCGYDQITNPRQFNYNIYEKNRMYDFIYYRNYVDINITLPEIKEETINIVLEDREKEIYDYYLGATKKVYNGFLVGSYNFSCVLTLFLRLRQLCVSPYTILAESARGYNKPEENDYKISQQILDEMTAGLATWLKDKYGTSGVKSSKITACMDLVSKIPEGEKVLIFTNFKKVIDVTTLALKKYNPYKKYLVLDGDCVGKDRDDTIDLFKDKEKGFDIMLVSYRVGAEGLNLTEANHVILFEPWWNGALKAQSVSRTHRIGQKKPVSVWNLIIENSIETRMDEICKKKEEMINDFIISKKKFSSRLDAATLSSIIN